jgi:hypothetical protein
MTLTEFAEQRFFCEKVKDLMYNMSVQLNIVSCSNQYIIHIGENVTRILSFNGGENPVHKALKCRRGVSKSEEHDLRFEDSIGGFENSLPLILVVYLNVVISPADV